MFEMHLSQFDLWQRLGRIRCASKTVKGPGGGPAKVYAVAELERAREQLAAEDAAAEIPPDGFLDIEGAARFFGVHPVTLNGWQGEGLVKATWHDLPGGRGRRRVYAIAELERARARMAEEAARPTAPPGFVELHEAARTLGVSAHTLYQWEKHGEITAGRVAPIPGTSARTKVYPIAEIERVRGEIRKSSERFPPEGWVEMTEAARRANVSVAVWKKWLMEGRVENWRWARRPTMARCKLFAVAEVERIVAELGRDHHFFMQPDGGGGWRPPVGWVGRAGAAEIFGVAEGTFVHWQTDGRITCGRWARIPVGTGTGEGGGRRVYPVEELRRLANEFSRVGKPYVDPKDPSLARVPIMSWGNTRFEAVIDAADLPLIEGIRWNWMPQSDRGDAVVVRSGPSGEQTPLRRILLGLKGRQWNVSHRNGDALDCRRTNLVVRDRTHTNAHARKRSVGFDGRPPTSRFKGVCWVEKAGKWLAQIQKEDNRRRLGYFDDEIAAAEAYDEAARELFGEHARPNFPHGIDDWLERAAA
jgi:DNA-binding transcriptional MerR regulator